MSVKLKITFKTEKKMNAYIMEVYRPHICKETEVLL